MPPPPVTPSPHRFVFKKERPNRQPLPPHENAPRSSAPQFNTAPRFTFSSTPRPTPSQVLPRSTPATSRYLTPGANPPQRKGVDVIDISSDEIPGDIYESIEAGQHNADIGYTSADLKDVEIEERSPKRRRLSDAVEIEEDLDLIKHEETGDQYMEEDLLSSLPILSSPAPRKTVSNTAPRFLISTPAPPSTPGPATPTSNTQAFLKPPRFRPPDPAEVTEARGDPLPDQFSPHRKGQKYVPGGLASEMRDLLMNLESTTAAKAPKLKESDWQVKLVIDEISGNERSGLTLVRGRQLHNMHGAAEIADTIGLVRVVLAGEGAGTGLHRGANAEAGKTVGIKGPMWEILIDGEKWGVGVDWKIL